jgi:putative ubiquitin-RnfH superfamily antitoxin RatB of RatAB toxin-antitoxin module
MADDHVRTIEIEIVYALPHEQFAQTLRVPTGTTLGEAIVRSDLMRRYPQFAIDSALLGIFGRRAIPSTVLREYDRIEIYRPLIADPKQSRRVRARRAPRSTR